MSFFHLPKAEPPGEPEYLVTTETEEPGQFYDGEAIPVHIQSQDASLVRSSSPEFGSCMTYPIPQQGAGSPPVQVLPRRIRRYKAHLALLNTNSVAGSVWLATAPNLIDSAVPVGFQQQLGGNNSKIALPDWEAQEPLYAVATITGIIISVFDTSYGEVSNR